MSKRGAHCFAALLLALWLPLAAAESQVDLGPPFIELQQPRLPVLEENADAAREPLLNAFAAGRYEEAVGLAQRALLAAQDVAKSEPNREKALIVPAQLDLATSQLHAGDVQAAIANYRQILQRLEAGGNSRAPALVGPLYGLGVAQFLLQDYANAVDNLQRAAFVSRVTQGLLSLEQLQHNDALIEGYLALGQYDAAIARQRAANAIVERATSDSSPEFFASLDKTADLLRRTHRYFEERELRRTTLARLEKLRGYDDPSLVPVLRELAATYRLSYDVDVITINTIDGIRQVVLPASNRIAVGDLQRALDILQVRPEEETYTERVKVLVELGDYHMAFNESPRALRFYNQAYQLLEKYKDDAQIQALFSTPVPVFIPRPDSAPGVGEQPAAGLPEGYVLFEFNLNSTGRPLSIKTLELKPEWAGIMRVRAERSIRLARFRPVIGPQGHEKSKDVRYKVKFRYAVRQE